MVEDGCRQAPSDHGHAQRTISETGCDYRGLRKADGNGRRGFDFENILGIGQNR